jgi:hypothetical protein
MRKYIIALLVLPLFFSCSKPSGIKEVIAGADSVAINYFKGDGTADTVVNMIMLKDKSQIAALAGYAEGGKAATNKCGYDGSIHIFKRDMVLQDINFSTHDEQCRRFSFLLNNKLYATKLSNGALQFITSLNKK